MNSQVLVDELERITHDKRAPNDISQELAALLIAMRALATPAPTPDAGDLEILIAAQVNEAYHERKTITEAAQAIVSALQASAMVVPDVARFEKHAMKARECLSECDVVLLSSIRRLLAASPTAKGGEL